MSVYNLHAAAISGAWDEEASHLDIYGKRPFIDKFDSLRDWIVLKGHKGIGVRVYLVRKEKTSS